MWDLPRNFVLKCEKECISAIDPTYVWFYKFSYFNIDDISRWFHEATIFCNIFWFWRKSKKKRCFYLTNCSNYPWPKIHICFSVICMSLLKIIWSTCQPYTFNMDTFFTKVFLHVLVNMYIQRKNWTLRLRTKMMWIKWKFKSEHKFNVVSKYNVSTMFIEFQNWHCTTCFVWMQKRYENLCFRWIFTFKISITKINIEVPNKENILVYMSKLFLFIREQFRFRY